MRCGDLTSIFVVERIPLIQFTLRADWAKEMPRWLVKMTYQVSVCVGGAGEISIGIGRLSKEDPPPLTTTTTTVGGPLPICRGPNRAQRCRKGACALSA